MTVYVDDMFMPAKVAGMRPAIWCHMQADTDEELHAFAAQLGLRRSWFQEKDGRPENNHYDVTKSVRAKAVKLGAVEETIEEGVERRRVARSLRQLI
jgi:hypothetical protein